MSYGPCCGLFNDENSSAIIDPTGKYRYSLTRTWEPSLPQILWIMLNPSTADETLNDPTIRRCISFSQAWAYGSLEVMNLFAYRATDPRNLAYAVDPVGPSNDHFINAASARVSRVVVAWGVRGDLHQRDRKVLSLLGSPYCLGKTRDGFPRHPLYVPALQPLIPYAKTKTMKTEI